MGKNEDGPEPWAGQLERHQPHTESAPVGWERDTAPWGAAEPLRDAEHPPSFFLSMHTSNFPGGKRLCLHAAPALHLHLAPIKMENGAKCDARHLCSSVRAEQAAPRSPWAPPGPPWPPVLQSCSGRAAASPEQGFGHDERWLSDVNSPARVASMKTRAQQRERSVAKPGRARQKKNGNQQNAKKALKISGEWLVLLNSLMERQEEGNSAGHGARQLGGTALTSHSIPMEPALLVSPSNARILHGDAAAPHKPSPSRARLPSLEQRQHVGGRKSDSEIGAGENFPCL